MKTYANALRFMIVMAMASVSTSAISSTFVITEDELDPDIFPQVAESIRANLDGPNAPVGLTSARKQDVLRSLSRLEDYLEEGSDSSTRKVLNEQRRINAALTPAVAKNNAKSDVVCKRVKRVGTNIPTTECRTRAEIEREEYEAQIMADELRQLQSLEDCPPNVVVC